MPSARKKYLRLFALCALFVVVLIGIGSCREIPPELPEDRDVLKAAGWPAPRDMSVASTRAAAVHFMLLNEV